MSLSDIAMPRGDRPERVSRDWSRCTVESIGHFAIAAHERRADICDAILDALWWRNKPSDITDVMRDAFAVLERNPKTVEREWTPTEIRHMVWHLLDIGRITLTTDFRFELAKPAGHIAHTEDTA